MWHHLVNTVEWSDNFQSKNDVHVKFLGDLTCHFDVMVGAQCTDARLLKMTYSFMYLGVVLHYYSTYSTTFGEHREIWSMINTVTLGFLMFFFAAEHSSCKLRVPSLIYLKTYPTPICINVSLWLFSPLPMVNTYVLDFPYFLPIVAPYDATWHCTWIHSHWMHCIACQCPVHYIQCEWNLNTFMRFYVQINGASTNYTTLITAQFTSQLTFTFAISVVHWRQKSLGCCVALFAWSYI